MADVLTPDDEVLTRLVLAAQDHMSVRVVGVPMVDRDPLQPRPEVALHPAHEMAGEAPQVVQLDAVFGRDDEAELMAIAVAALLERFHVRASVSAL